MKQLILGFVRRCHIGLISNGLLMCLWHMLRGVGELSPPMCQFFPRRRRHRTQRDAHIIGVGVDRGGLGLVECNAVGRAEVRGVVVWCGFVDGFSTWLNDFIPRIIITFHHLICRSGE